MFLQHKRNCFVKFFCSLIVGFVFIVSTILPPQIVHAQTSFNLPVPGTMLPLSSAFIPPMIKGINLIPDQPLQFDFIIDNGDVDLEGDEFNQEATKLIKYFLAALTMKEKEMWVNLSPYEKDRIIPESFGQTEMGRDILAQDYLLKQLTASLAYPENDLGKEFWNRVYTKAQAQFGTTEIPLNTFNKVWIVPESANVYEHDKGAFVVESHLKVMLEEDYLALESNKNRVDHGLGDVIQEDLNVISGVSSEVVREVLIPEIEREVNQGQTFANLRQIFNSMILATWYKQNLKESVLGQVYVEQNKLKGVALDDASINQKIYDQYIEAFKIGVYDYIKEDYDPATKKIIPRKYFSGGVEAEWKNKLNPVSLESISSSFIREGQTKAVSVNLQAQGQDAIKLNQVSSSIDGVDKYRRRFFQGILAAPLIKYGKFLKKRLSFIDVGLNTFGENWLDTINSSKRARYMLDQLPVMLKASGVVLDDSTVFDNPDKELLPWLGEAWDLHQVDPEFSVHLTPQEIVKLSQFFYPNQWATSPEEIDEARATKPEEHRDLFFNNPSILEYATKAMMQNNELWWRGLDTDSILADVQEELSNSLGQKMLFFMKQSDLSGAINQKVMESDSYNTRVASLVQQFLEKGPISLAEDSFFQSWLKEVWESGRSDREELVQGNVNEVRKGELIKKIRFLEKDFRGAFYASEELRKVGSVKRDKELDEEPEFLKISLKTRYEKEPLSEEALDVQKRHYLVMIKWVKYILENYHERFGGNKLLFIGGATKRGYQAAMALSEQFGVDKRNVVYFDFPRDVSRDTSPEDVIKILEQEGVFEGEGPIAFLDFARITGESVRFFKEIIENYDNRKVIDFFLFSDNRDDSMLRNDFDNPNFYRVFDFFDYLKGGDFESRRQKLISYKPESNKIVPVYFNYLDVENLLEEIQDNLVEFSKNQGVLSLKAQETWSIAKQYLKRNGVDLDDLNVVLKVLRSSLAEMPQHIADQQDQLFERLLQEEKVSANSSSPLGNRFRQAAEGMASQEFISALGLNDATLISEEQRDGYKVQTIQISGGFEFKEEVVPLGIDLLQSELASVNEFDLIVNDSDQLIAVFPKVDLIDDESHYFNLSDFYIPIEKLQKVDFDEINKGFYNYLDIIKRNRSFVKDYIDALSLDKSRFLVQHSSDRPSYAFVSLHPDQKSYSVDGINLFEEDNKDPNVSMNYATVHMSLRNYHAIIPVYPSVYNPLLGNRADKDFVLNAYTEMNQLPLKDGDYVLDAATGTGLLVWIQSIVAQEQNVDLKYHAFDINPLAVANAKLTAAIQGLDLDIQRHNGFISPEGEVAFYNDDGKPQKFKFITSNNPAFIRVLNGQLLLGEASNGLAGFHDAGTAGFYYAWSFVSGAHLLMEENTVIIAWNLLFHNQDNFYIAMHHAGYDIAYLAKDSERVFSRTFGQKVYRITRGQLSGNKGAAIPLSPFFRKYKSLLPKQDNQKDNSSSSSLSAPGGIDMNPAAMNLNINRNSKKNLTPFPQQPLQNINIEGFVPIIINVVPITVPQFLGFLDDGGEQEQDHMGSIPNKLLARNELELN